MRSKLSSAMRGTRWFRKSTRRRTQSRYRVWPMMERLEPIELLARTGLFWADTSQLTLSFAPDGTDIAGEPSQLFHALDQVTRQHVWQEALLRAFQTWVIHINGNVGVVTDQGQPFGTAGPRTQDPRFGDIRVGARPLSDGVMAISVSHDTLISGTWAGDVLINSQATFRNEDEIFAAALHEAGHVLGLQHSDDPASPMFTHGLPTATQPTDADIAALQAQHGRRVADKYDSMRGNNTLNTATPLAPLGGLSGQVSPPLLVYGDITTPRDVDYFRIQAVRRNTGPVTIRLQTSQISLLAPSLRVFSQDGVELASTRSVRPGGATLLVRANDVRPDQMFFVEVSAARHDEFQIGGYSLIISADNTPTVDASRVDEVATVRIRDLSPEQIRSLLYKSGAVLDDDRHQNDTRANAMGLSARPGFDDTGPQEVVASISDASDVDFYRFDVRKPADDREVVAHVSVRSLEPGRLVPEATIYDSRQRAVPADILVNGNGEYLIQALLEPRGPYYLRVQAARPDGLFETGNYRVTLSYAQQPIVLNTFAQDSVGGSTTQKAHHVYVALPQLFHFVLQVDNAATTVRQAVLANFYDDQGNLVHRLVAAPGETRTSHSVLLMPGIYTLQVLPVTLRRNALVPMLYQIRGLAVSDPFAVDPDDPTEDPIFQCPGLEDVYCYPGGIMSDDPFLFDEFLDSLPEVPNLNWPELIDALLGDWWSWYWNQSGQNGPPLAMDDSYSTAQNTMLTAAASSGVLANDTEPEQETLVAYVEVEPQFGTLVLEPDGSFTYMPDSGFVGVDRFEYVAYDFRTFSEPAVVTIEVSGSGVGSGDFNGDGRVDLVDVQLLSDGVRQAQDNGFDLNGDGSLNQADLVYLVQAILRTSLGDTNLDGRFDSTDLVAVFQAGHYEDGIQGNSQYVTGDWNCDGEFDSGDLVAAFQQGGYVAAASATTSAATVPSFDLTWGAAVASDSGRKRKPAAHVV